MIPDLLAGVLNPDYAPSLCCVEGVIYVGGGGDVDDTVSNALQVLQLFSACVHLAGRFEVGGESEDAGLCTRMFSYDPRTGRWRPESPLPLEDHGLGADSSSDGLSAVTHDGRVVVVLAFGTGPTLRPLNLTKKN